MKLLLFYGYTDLCSSVHCSEGHKRGRVGVFSMVPERFVTRFNGFRVTNPESVTDVLQ